MGKRTIRLIGHMKSEHLDELREQVEDGESPVALDLGEVDLVDIEAVRFLNTCESAGVSILHCSPFIREWMRQERGRPNALPEP